MNRIDWFNAYWNRVNSAKGRVILDLGMGMPDANVCPNPQLITDAIAAAIGNGLHTAYAQPIGNSHLRELVAELESRRLPPTACPYDAKEVAISNGAINGFSQIIDLLCPPASKVVLVTPSYFTVAARLEQTNHLVSPSLPVLRRTSDDYLALLAHDVQAVVICQPENPTGLYLLAEDMRRLITEAERRNVWIIIDETCDHCRHTNVEWPIAECRRENVVRIHSASKRYNLSGLRVGYLLAPADTITSLANRIPPLYGNPNPIGMYILERIICEQLKLNEVEHDRHFQNYISRAKAQTMAWLRSTVAVSDFIDPGACYYVLARLNCLAGCDQLCQQLLERSDLDIVPGTLFGLPSESSWMRLCFGRSEQTLNEAFHRIERFHEAFSQNVQ